MSLPFDLSSAFAAGLGVFIAQSVKRFVDGLASPVMSALNTYLLGTHDAKTGGDFTNAVVVTEFEPLVAQACLAMLTAVAIWAAYRLMFAHSVRGMYSVRVLLPRIALAAFLIEFAMPLFQAAIDFNNALAVQVTQTHALQLPETSWWEAILGKAEAELIVLLILLAGYGVLALAYVVRYALLVLLAITAPIAALLFVLPETHHYARKWGSLFVSSLFMQPLQLLILAVALRLETSAATGPVQHLYPLAALWLCFKVPGTLHVTSTIASQAITKAKHYAHVATHPPAHPRHA